ncbi:MAG TPA: formate dehydrogenase subunit delta [Actinomycetes bacterium]|nr:formate dehydrogenase subunit delta [Actinomycetes bacterium]
MTQLPYVRLANDIAAQFHHLSTEDAATGIATHMQMFWDPSMRGQLLAHVAAGGQDLDPLVLIAAERLRTHASA